MADENTPQRVPVKPDNAEPAPDLYWSLLKMAARPLRRMHRIRVAGAGNLPATGQGGAIVAALHNGALDAVFIAIAASARGRAIRFVADEDICNAPVIGKMIRKAGCIPIASFKGQGTNPDQIRKAMSEAAAVLRDGGVVGLFPEGIIHPFFKTRYAYQFKTGIIRLALESRAPIIPAWARGAASVFPWLSNIPTPKGHVYAALPVWTPARVAVHFGKPFVIPESITLESPHEEIREQSQRLQFAVDDLRNSHRRRYTPNYPDEY
jgi:1-acyl-sn-glycerol-3-phosphate acyltransferase